MFIFYTQPKIINKVTAIKIKYTVDSSHLQLVQIVFFTFNYTLIRRLSNLKGLLLLPVLHPFTYLHLVYLC